MFTIIAIFYRLFHFDDAEFIVLVVIWTILITFFTILWSSVWNLFKSWKITVMYYYKIWSYAFHCPCYWWHHLLWTMGLMAAPWVMVCISTHLPHDSDCHNRDPSNPTMQHSGGLAGWVYWMLQIVRMVLWLY